MPETQKSTPEETTENNIVSICMECKKIKIKKEDREHWVSCTEYIAELKKDINIFFIKCSECNIDRMDHPLNHYVNHLFICPQCKNFLDCDQQWKQIEKFIGDTLNKINQCIELSHGYCPTCGDKAIKKFEDLYKFK